MSSKIKIVIGVVLVVVLALIIVLGIGLLSGGDDDDRPGTSDVRESGDGDGDGGGGDDDGAPKLRTVASKRAEGTRVTAAAGAVIKRPKEIWLRVSAAPKQEVDGSWNVSCAGGGTTTETFAVTPPYLKKLPLPRKNARSCVGGVSARINGKGRLKVAILRPR